MQPAARLKRSIWIIKIFGQDMLAAQVALDELFYPLNVKEKNVKEKKNNIFLIYTMLKRIKVSFRVA